MFTCDDEIVNVCCKDDIVSILRDLPHAFLVSYLRATFSLEEFAHGRKPRTGRAGHSVKRPLKEVPVGGVFRVAGWGGNVNVSVLVITVEQGLLSSFF